MLLDLKTFCMPVFFSVWIENEFVYRRKELCSFDYQANISLAFWVIKCTKLYFVIECLKYTWPSLFNEHDMLMFKYLFQKALNIEWDNMVQVENM